MSRLERKIDDRLTFGVPYVGMIDCKRPMKSWTYTAEGMHEARDAVLRTEDPDIAVPLKDRFEE